jgi:hypothetical protein
MRAAIMQAIGFGSWQPEQGATILQAIVAQSEDQ